MAIFSNGKKLDKYKFKLESEFEDEIVKNSKAFFGKDTLYLDTKKKIKTESLGATIPDGFLIDFKDKDNPDFYIVEVELSKHSFYSHIFPQITKFFAFFNTSNKQKNLVNNLYELIENNEDYKSQIKKYLDGREIFKFISDIIEDSQNILLVIDDEKPELEEIMNTYSDTWGRMVKNIVVQKHFKDSEVIYSLNPEFDDIDYVQTDEGQKNGSGEVIEFTEQAYLERKKTKIPEVYNEFKNRVLEFDNKIIFNPQKYYVSLRKKRNAVFIKVRTKKIILVIRRAFEEVKAEINHHVVKELSGSVQKFWGGTCCGVVLTNNDNMEEIINCIKPLFSE